MRRLELDLAATRRRSILPWVALLAALALAADATHRHAELAALLGEAQSRLQRREAAPQRPVVLDAGTARDFRQAEQVIGRLALPWDALFRAVEDAADERVALMTIEPDAQKGEVRLGGEAADYDAVIGYIERLGAPGLLVGAHLLRHELREDQPGQPVRFTVVARWGGAR
ncbi:MAG: PilN domain-containing protein [Rhizobacter sp.]|nr:PilN domain-containing protein [Rhizobacter sp.]